MNYCINYGIGYQHNNIFSALKGKKSLQGIKQMNMKSWSEQTQFHTKTKKQLLHLKRLMKSEMSIGLRYRSIQTVLSA